MNIQANTIKGKKGSRHKTKRVGRGNATQKGTTAGRGMKGQRARSGGKGGTTRIGFKQSLLKIPKNRGFKSQYAKPGVVTLKTLNGITKDNDKVDLAYLVQKKVITKSTRDIKLVGSGQMTKKITLVNIKLSKGAAESIIKAGGSVL